jgi:hypothetical protein
MCAILKDPRKHEGFLGVFDFGRGERHNSPVHIRTPRFNVGISVPPNESDIIQAMHDRSNA